MKKQVLFLFLSVIFIMSGLMSGCEIIVDKFFDGKMSGVFTGGPTYQKRDTAISELKNSGFTMVEVWTIHIESNGDMGFNAEFDLIKDGKYIGDKTYPHFKSDIAGLTYGSTITKVNFGLSAAGSGTFNNIRTLVNNEGTGPESTLYKNFKALREAFPNVYAIDFDDESTYDLSSATSFGIMLADIGFKVAICPYTYKSFWKQLVSNIESARPGAVDAVYLQTYAGGSGNNPGDWHFDPDIPVYPGLDRNSRPLLESWKTSAGITGAWIWLYDDIQGDASSYASTINDVFDISFDIPK